ncbi:hypothetical protein CYMTET_4748 [Cymbomonas tetramitiformis]|uniref:Uncharacterized protein n=1 Tax=Cymbomonas tetramitiformis TaxID=36881 RepID=A0AAE0H0S4_9CHLO|nr:hypothetical protein CYMTET_4748 [Cymbomonas tetramitiformis]
MVNAVAALALCAVALLVHDASAENCVDLGNLGCGIACNDGNSGYGYLMYSEQSWHQRGSVHNDNADHFACVKYDGGTWYYDTNSAWAAFSVASTGSKVGLCKYRTFLVPALTYAPCFCVSVALVSDISSSTRAPPTTAVTCTSLGDVNCGVACNDGGKGYGYLMFSEQSWHRRGIVYHDNADHVACVRLEASTWYYDTNSKWVAFDVVSTDVLVAMVDFTSDKVVALPATATSFNGVQYGTSSGDLTFEADRWCGGGNDGEFGVGGSSFCYASAAEDVQCLGTGDLGKGVACNDKATGDGYLLYSKDTIPEVYKGGAEHIACARYSNNAWSIDNNDGWTSFSADSQTGASSLLPLPSTARIELRTARLGSVPPLSFLWGEIISQGLS